MAATRLSWSLVLLMNVNLGCLSERSFQMKAEQGRVAAPATLTATADAIDTRQWLRTTHAQLADLLPAERATPLLTEQLSDGKGHPADVLAHFGLRREQLQSLLANFDGIRCTAQAASRDYCIDNPAPPWPEFEDVWVPIHNELALSGRLGYAKRDGRIIDADCIVILPGLYGDNGVIRTMDLSVFLRERGFHVLALEVRGHGRTEWRYPEMGHTFGILEADDLMVVSDWLEELPHVRRTGLIGYCWGANIALLAGWYDGRPPGHPGILPVIEPYLAPPSPKRRFSAGIISFSPILAWEVMLDALDQPCSQLSAPVYHAIQQTVRDRMVRKNHPEQSGNLRHLIKYEYELYYIPLPHGELDGYPFIRLLPYKDEPYHDKMTYVRTPTLIVHGSNDPLAPAQDVAEFVALTDNPLVAALILPGGGHVGFAAYAAEYYYSLVTSFFDPAHGAAAQYAGTHVDGLPATAAAQR